MTGYRDPPTDTRFQKGQSGNPNGRPRKAKIAPEWRDKVPNLAKQPITVRENGEPKQIDATEGILRSQLKSALGGSTHAQRHLLASIERATTEKRQNSRTRSTGQGTMSRERAL
jgi:hypothetical protein